MQSYLLYQKYALKFGHTFEEKTLSERGWRAALTLMQRALETDGPAVTTTSVRDYLKALSGPVCA